MGILDRLRAPRAGKAETPRDESGENQRRSALSEADELARAGRFGDALRRVDDAQRNDADDPDVLFVRGSILLQWGRLQEAIAHLAKAEAKGARGPDLDLQLGLALLQRGSAAEAEARIRRVIDARAESMEAHYALGIALHAQGRVHEATDEFERLLAREPRHVDTLIRLGNCRLEEDDPVRAEAAFRRAIAVESHCAAAWSDLSVALHRQDRNGEGIDASATATLLDGTTNAHGSSFINLAKGLADDGRLAEALAVYEEWLPVRPYPSAHYDYGLALLTAGRLAEGWPHAEFRWMDEPLLSKRIASNRPAWSGECLAGKTLLLRAEQGIGDTIQFLRYAPALKALGATVLLKVQEGFEPFARGFPGIDRVLDAGPTPVEFDYYVHPMSLPGVFGTDLATVPAPVPYLTPDPDRVARWRARIGPSDELKVGLVWAGNPAHLRDRFRSLPLAQLAPLAGVPGVRFFALQKGSGERDAAAPPAGFLLENLGPELADFQDTAAALGELDLVVCVDTSVAHLAGALGRPVWVLLPRPADWRWLADDECSPWYPTMRLFRQRARGDWAEVIGRVRDALAVVASEPERRNHENVATTGAPLSMPRPSRTRSGFCAVAETRLGIMQYAPDEPDTGVAIGHYGEVLQRELDLIAQLLRPGATVVEAGSGVGAHALALSRIAGSGGRLFLYESAPRTRQILQQNLAANRVANAILMRGALGSHSSPDVAMETVDDLHLPALALLKIAGRESGVDVVGGAEQTLWRLRPMIFSAVRDDAALAELSGQVEPFGYRRWRVETPMYNPKNFNLRDDDAFGGRTALALLAIPEEVVAEIDAATCVELP